MYLIQSYKQWDVLTFLHLFVFISCTLVAICQLEFLYEYMDMDMGRIKICSSSVRKRYNKLEKCIHVQLPTDNDRANNRETQPTYELHQQGAI